MLHIKIYQLLLLDKKIAWLKCSTRLTEDGTGHPSWRWQHWIRPWLVSAWYASADSHWYEDINCIFSSYENDKPFILIPVLLECCFIIELGRFATNCIHYWQSRISVINVSLLHTAGHPQKEESHSRHGCSSSKQWFLALDAKPTPLCVLQSLNVRFEIPQLVSLLTTTNGLQTTHHSFNCIFVYLFIFIFTGTLPSIWLFHVAMLLLLYP